MHTLIDRSWLIKQGIELPNEASEDLIARFQQACESRVGDAIADRLTDEDVAEFEDIDKRGDTNAANKLLDRVYPDYGKLVWREARKLRKEIREADDKIALIESWATPRE